jgi:hypothetical protein
MNRTGWLALAVGMVLGIAAGLYYAWGVNPVAYLDTAPASLRADFRADYLTLIAVAYAGEGDLARARARLGLFPDTDPAQTLAALAQQRLALGRPPSEAQALALLSSALGERPTPFPGSDDSPTGAAVSPAPSRTPTATPTPRPTHTPTATPGAPYTLVEQERVCSPSLSPPRLMVVVSDGAGRPVAGVEVLVVWDAGQSRFFTGLKPELGVGYADYDMESGVTYTLELAYSDDLVTDLTAEPCAGDDGTPYPGSWRLWFTQP